jgi:hypothetical protein
MKFKLMAVVLIIFSLALAQGPSMFNPFAGVNTPRAKEKIGSWCEYNLQTEDADNSGKMKISLVGSEECDGQDCHWIEIEINSEEGDRIIFKYLVKGRISEGKESYFSMIMKSNDDPAWEFEIDSEEMKDIPEEEYEMDFKEYKDLPDLYDSPEMTITEETIKVPAGKFECHRITYIDTSGNERMDIWVTEDIPVTGIVKLKSSDTEMELLKYGWKGAKTAITEKPKKFSIKEMLKQGLKESAEEESKEAGESIMKKSLKSIFGR